MIIYWLFCLQSSFIGAIAIGDLVKSTLGPKGMVSRLKNLELLFVNIPSVFCGE